MGATCATVLSGKGGTAKTLWQMTMAGEASRREIPTLLLDLDPERNMSNRLGIPQHSTGIGSVLEAAEVTAGDGDAEKGAKRVDSEIVGTSWEHIDLLPAGSSLTGVSQVAMSDAWLLRDILDKAGIYDRYQLILIDTGGRTGSLVTLAMYAADAAYAPIAPTTDAVRKAIEARTRVERIQRAHPLRWAGVVLSGFDLRASIQQAIREEVLAQFGDQVRAEVPRRAAVDEAFQVGDRLGDRRDVSTAQLAEIFQGFLLRDLMGRTIPAGDGVLR